MTSDVKHASPPVADADGTPSGPAAAARFVSVTLRRDRLVQGAAALGLLWTLAYHGLPAGAVRSMVGHVAELAMIGSVLAAVCWRLSDRPPLARSFWRLWAAGLSCWAAVALIDLSAELGGLQRPFGRWLAIARTLGYTGIYLGAIVALELRPHAPAAEGRFERFRWLVGLGSALTVLALCVYFVILPSGFDLAIVRSNVPASVLYLCLDCLLLWRLAPRAAQSGAAWRAGYACLMGVAALWTLSDGAEVLRWAGVLGEGRFLWLMDLVWLPQFLGLALAARVTLLSSGEGSSAAISDEPRGTQLLAQTLLLPGFHAVLLASGSWEPAHHAASSLWIFAVLVLLGGLTVFQLRSVERLAEARALELRSAYTELAASVEAMRSARDQAEAANQAKSRFLAMMSHEIRTPMNGVLGTASLLLRSRLSDAQRQLLDTIQASGRSLLGILDDVLDLSRLEVGRLRLQLETFEVATLIEDVGASLGELAQGKGLELAVIAEGLRRPLCGDPARLRQILTNLLGNAIKFTDHGQVAVHARLLSEDTRTATVLLEVADTGVGIPPEAAERLFRPFSQAAGGAARGGSGLGLLISRQLAALMGGDIEFESQPGRGSVFRVTLCLSLPADADAAPSPRPATPARRALLVEPRTLTRFALQRLCAELGVATRLATNAKAALRTLTEAAARGEPFDAALVDSELLRSNDAALLRRLRDDARLEPLRLVAVGAPLAESVAGEAERLPLLPTPVRLRSLSQALSRDLSASASVTGPARTDAAGRGRALVVDDNPVNQAVAEGMLVLLGFEVHLADDGHQALKRLEAERFDVVLMDYMMPGMDGVQVTEELRRRERSAGRPPTPVVALTAVAMAGDRERCLAAGMNDYLAKPFAIEQLEDVLAAVAPAGARSEPSPAPTRPEPPRP
jgi:signal transduction histidine kinase/CheY-like chemotaxis protein